MRFYQRNKAKAVYNNTEPTMTDQSQARETDINVIVGKYGIGALAPGNAAQPMYMDFTDMPRDLRGYIEQARALESLRANLPEQLRGQKLEELLQLTPQQIHGLLFPEQETTEPKKEETNK